eukprot:scaffold2499_cov125-Cylindrotheca_fusiformis.AAC.12
MEVEMVNAKEYLPALPRQRDGRKSRRDNNGRFFLRLRYKIQQRLIVVEGGSSCQPSVKVRPPLPVRSAKLSMFGPGSQKETDKAK